MTAATSGITLRVLDSESLLQETSFAETAQRTELNFIILLCISVLLLTNGYFCTEHYHLWQ